MVSIPARALICAQAPTALLGREDAQWPDDPQVTDLHGEMVFTCIDKQVAGDGMDRMLDELRTPPPRE